MTAEPEIFARLTALHSALVEKLNAQPWSSPQLTMTTRGQCEIAIYKEGPYGSGREIELHTARAQTIEATLADAEAFVAAMSDPASKAERDWHRKLGDVIDEGHALALPDDVMKPLRGASRAMAKNLLAAPTA